MCTAQATKQIASGSLLVILRPKSRISLFIVLRKACSFLIRANTYNEVDCVCPLKAMVYVLKLFKQTNTYSHHKKVNQGVRYRRNRTLIENAARLFHYLVTIHLSRLIVVPIVLLIDPQLCLISAFVNSNRY